MHASNPCLCSSAGAELNLRSQMLFLENANSNANDLVTTAAAWNMRYLHESSHWVRFHGSTFGVLLMLLRRTRDQLASYTINDMTVSDIAKFSRDRANSQPLFDYRENTPNNRLGDTLSRRRQDWLDLHYAYHLFLDQEYISSAVKLWPATEAVEAALNITWHQSSGLEMLTKPQGSQGEVTFSDKVGLVESGEGILSTRLLFECAAVLDELFQEVGTLNKAADSSLRKMLGHVFDGDYGLPYRFAERIAGRELDPITILSLIDFAINPAIPGLHSRESITSWQEMYPPLRFAEAARALSAWGVEEIVSWPSPALLHLLHRELEARTSLRMGRIMSDISKLNSIRECANTPLHYSERIPSLTLLYSSKLFMDREVEPHRLSHFGVNFIGSDALRYVDPDQDAWWMFPPLRVIQGGYQWPAERVNDSEATILLIGSAVSAAFDEVVHSTAPLGLDHLPAREFTDMNARAFFGDELVRAVRFPVSWT
ncbi:hypothetical protein SAMN04489713_102153 [Actinomadura madurae]|uniref:Uncharacterized protein n=1 Tax=Actinomadura madurae TaxID=1993 RepID=A0A1I4ZDD0_9ACTN|nr:hypothetical protein [Actinomadura madurae]SFN47989.1 hypothetical protein SAMN04489713_102153 [Actinomadura madurae]